jgi:molecular chaperone GrpE
MSILQSNAEENEELDKSPAEGPSEEAVSPDLAGKNGGEQEAPSLANEAGDASDDADLAELASELDSLDPDNILADSVKKSGEASQNHTGQDEKIAELEARAADLSARLDDTHDQLLRKTADFDNYRKRMNQEKQKAIEFANESLLLDIIPVMDDFERAIQSAETSEELKSLPAGKVMLDGITMIEKQLVSKLENKWGLKRYNSAGEAFDPNLHEAMLMEKSPDIEEPVIQEDFVKGYMLKDRVIRTAKVKVLMPEDE